MKCALLSEDPGVNSVVLVGIGGTGKTTILCALGNDEEINDKYRDGVWFFRLGHDITLSSFIRQLELLVKSACPDFVADFKQLAASEDTHCMMINHLLYRLSMKHFLLLFDDVSDVNADVYGLACAVCQAVQGNNCTSLKILTSTSSRVVSDAFSHSLCAEIDPGNSDADRSLRIFCHYASMEMSDVSLLSDQNRDALDHVLEICQGLPLALRMAGSTVRQLMYPSVDQCDQSAIGRYWGRLASRTRSPARAEGGDKHLGLTSILETSIQFLEDGWESTKAPEKLPDHLTVQDMFHSFCIVQKQTCLPVGVIERLWGVTDVQSGLLMFSRNSLVSEVREEGKGIIEVCAHDLVLDISVRMAENQDGMKKWHAKLLDAYQMSRSGSGSTGDRGSDKVNEWWNLAKNDKYMVENIVRHLLGAGRVTDALLLLTDYRWVELMNEDKERLPFQKTIADLQLLLVYLKKTETDGKIVRDMDLVVSAMKLCLIPHCMRNRDECTFQLYGRLRDVSSESGVVERLVYTIERYGQRPWARAGQGVLASAKGRLRRVIEVESDIQCISVGTRGDEIVVGRKGGNVSVLNSLDGSTENWLVGHEEDDIIVDVFVDSWARKIYSCSSRGRVIIWNEYKKWQSLQAGTLDEEEITCMQILCTQDKAILGTNLGRLLVIDVNSGNTMPTLDVHTDSVTSLAVDTSKVYLVSASKDETIIVWDMACFGDTRYVLQGHMTWMRSVILSGDGKLLASGSSDGTIHLWDLELRDHRWTSSDEHGRPVECVVFSADDRLLYSADYDTICVWRMSNGGRDVALLQTLCHTSIYDIDSLCIAENSELLVLHRNGVHVWNVGQIGSKKEGIEAFVSHVRKFAVSADGATVLTWSEGAKHLEIRNLSEITQGIDRVIWRFRIGHRFQPESLAVSNDQRLIAYSSACKCVVHVGHVRSRQILHSLSNLEHWVLSKTADDACNSSNCSTSDDSSSMTGGGPWRDIESLWFSADGSVISGVGVAAPIGDESTVERKSLSWSVASGEAVDDAQLVGESGGSNGTATARLVCQPQLSSVGLRYSGDVVYELDGTSFVIASLEDDVTGAYYCCNSRRLWIASFDRGMYFVDLITDHAHLRPGDEASLPIVSHLSASQQ